jgi:hypothetical protein
VDGETGDLVDFVVYNPSTLDHFTYSIEIQDERLMLYGLLFDSQKSGFVAFFNSKLRFEEAVKFAPFESFGASNIASNGEVAGRSGSYHSLLDKKGEYKWALNLKGEGPIRTIGGPFESSDGFIYEATSRGMNFFYKIRRDGSLDWTSELFQSSGNGVVLSSLPDGSFLGTYSYPVGDATKLSQLNLSNNGTISAQRKLDISMTLSIGNIYQSVSDLNTIILAGNTNPFSLSTPDIKDFILQYQRDDEEGNCLNWNSFEELFLNDLIFDFDAYTFETQNIEMTPASSVRIRMIDFSFPLLEFCDEIIPAEELSEIRTLQCNEDWEVSLPNEDFQWDDIGSNKPGVLSEPGTYRARKVKCSDPVIVELKFEKPDCDCNIYIPNVLIVSGSKGNQQFSIASNCSIISANFSVYDRWGQLVHESTGINIFWEPFRDENSISLGVYVCILEYELLDINGNIQKGIKAQDLTLIR